MRSDFLVSILKENAYSIFELPQDASGRRYSRIKCTADSFILKEYDPKSYDPADFIKITELLRNNKISSPKIYKYDSELGLMLIQDLGYDTVRDVLVKNPDNIFIIDTYLDIVNLLIEIQKIDISNLNKYHDINNMMDGLELFIKFYPQYVGVDLSDQEKQRFLEIFRSLLENFNFSSECFVHRDFHVENIILKDGIYSVIDYQDASIGSPLYDLISLVEDARINVDEEARKKIIKHYCDAKNIDINVIENEFDLLATQRNLRILGVFSYHKVKNNNKKYLSFIPRVLNYLKRDLSNPMLSEILIFLETKGIIV
jgi:aminoglycoside/choline kinase family phosphotransferase